MDENHVPKTTEEGSNFRNTDSDTAENSAIPISRITVQEPPQTVQQKYN
jgi:hypothetical protein